MSINAKYYSQGSVTETVIGMNVKQSPEIIKKAQDKLKSSILACKLLKQEKEQPKLIKTNLSSKIILTSSGKENKQNLEKVKKWATVDTCYKKKK